MTSQKRRAVIDRRAKNLRRMMEYYIMGCVRESTVGMKHERSSIHRRWTNRLKKMTDKEVAAEFEFREGDVVLKKDEYLQDMVYD